MSRRSIALLAGTALVVAAAYLYVNRDVAPVQAAVVPDQPNHVKGAEPAHISMGQPVALTDHLVPGMTTVIDFYSEYCPPCREIGPHLVKLHAARADLAVVKVDINRPGVRGIDWDSPVARQYELHSIPHFKVFGPDGKLQAEGDPAYELVAGWVK